jgi:hypothetical protein
MAPLKEPDPSSVGGALSVLGGRASFASTPMRGRDRFPVMLDVARVKTEDKKGIGTPAIAVDKAGADPFG